jgi:Transposase DDE domain
MIEGLKTLGEIFKRCLPHERRDECDFAALFVALIIKFRTVNLMTLAPHVPGDALIASNYRRLQRMISNFSITPESIISLILSTLVSTELTLIVDRTNWKIGRYNVNILVIAVRHNGTAIPLMWDFLEHPGNSSQDKRLSLFDRLMECLPIQYKIVKVLGDREFIGDKWLAYLTQIGAEFCVRIKSDALITQESAGIYNRPLSLYTQILKNPSQVLTIPDCKVYGNRGTLQATLSSENALVIVLAGSSVENPLVEYSNRWGIEQMFESLKSYGFRLEDTNLRDSEKLNRLVCFLSIAYCFSICVGESCEKVNSTKSHGRLEKSIFRRGLDALQSVMRDSFSAITKLLPYFSINRFFLPVLRI